MQVQGLPELHNEFKSSHRIFNEPPSQIKNEKRVEDVFQWWSTCLTCVKSCVRYDMSDLGRSH